MRLLPLTVLALLSVSSAAPAFAALKPTCGRSHEYAVELLAKPQRWSATNPNRFGWEPGYIASDGANRLLESGDYVRSYSYDDYFQMNPAMQMGIGNSAGRWKIGLCWWHSRFHRAAIYLMDFDPRAPKPSPSEAKALFKKVIRFEPVTVPGYSSLYQFTLDFSKELEAVLSDWQKQTTLKTPENVVGTFLAKVATTPSQKRRMFTESAWKVVESLYAIPRPIFLFAENAGSIHGYLAVGFQRMNSAAPEYWLTFVDSNHPGTSLTSPFIKRSEFVTGGEETNGVATFGVLEGFPRDFLSIQNGLRTKCGANYRIPLK